MKRCCIRARLCWKILPIQSELILTFKVQFKHQKMVCRLYFKLFWWKNPNGFDCIIFFLFQLKCSHCRRWFCHLNFGHRSRMTLSSCRKNWKKSSTVTPNHMRRTRGIERYFGDRSLVALSLKSKSETKNWTWLCHPFMRLSFMSSKNRVSCRFIFRNKSRKQIKWRNWFMS